MQRLLAIVGAGALLAAAGLGVFAWTSAARRVTVDFVDAEQRERDAAQLAELREELRTLHEDVRALAGGMSAGLQQLHDAFVAAQEGRAAGNGGELASRDASTAAEAGPPAGAAAPGAVSAEPGAVPAEPGAVPAEPGTVAAAAAGKPKKSFLAFQLPSDDVRFDERRSWSVLPSLSRVGFDGKSTLHDFTATSSSIEGELDADLSRAGEAPRARVVVQAETLRSDNAKRDAEMLEILEVERHPTLEFELARFEAGEADVAGRRLSGVAHGKLTLRGVSQEVAMPVKLSIDDARRLCVDGELPLDLTRFDVPVPSKLGLITMEDEVRVWISLRLRANPRQG